MPTLVDSSETLAVGVSCPDGTLTVVLDDGRTLSVPLVWFPRLFNASHKERNDWKSIGGGFGIHWEAVDKDISVASLPRPEKFMRLVTPALHLTPLPPRSHRGGTPSPRKKGSPRGGNGRFINR
jgi:hypothetical protein